MQEGMMKRRILTSNSRGYLHTLILAINVLGCDLNFRGEKTSANARRGESMNIFSEAE
jgi:hypothetical protein